LSCAGTESPTLFDLRSGSPNPKRVSKKLLGALFAVTGAMAASWAFNLKQHVHVLGAIPRGLPRMGLPDVDWTWELLWQLAPTGFAMFVVILAQSAATSRANAARYNEDFSEDSDLSGLAMANLGAGLSGTFVVNGSPTKTQMIDSAGGRSQLSQLVTTVIVGLVLLLFTGAMPNLPESVLSAVVFLIGI
jgi:MFS superfamily sulfate permease-like transporter